MAAVNPSARCSARRGEGLNAACQAQPGPRGHGNAGCLRAGCPHV